MKRSQTISLVMMAGAASTTTGCGDGGNADLPPGPTFPSIEACSAAGNFTQSTCETIVKEAGRTPAVSKNYASAAECTADGYFTDTYCIAKFDEAVKLHQDYAPAYQNVNSCEQDYGAMNCGRQTAQGGGGSFWTPFLTGYLVSNAINSFTRPMPYYRDPYGGGFSTLGGYRFNGGRQDYRISRTDYNRGDAATRGARNADKAKAKQLRTKPQRTAVARRGGFGGRSSAGG